MFTNTSIDIIHRVHWKFIYTAQPIARARDIFVVFFSTTSRVWHDLLYMLRQKISTKHVWWLFILEKSAEHDFINIHIVFLAIFSRLTRVSSFCSKYVLFKLSFVPSAHTTKCDANFCRIVMQFCVCADKIQSLIPLLRTIRLFMSICHTKKKSCKEFNSAKIQKIKSPRHTRTIIVTIFLSNLNSNNVFNFFFAFQCFLFVILLLISHKNLI